MLEKLKKKKSICLVLGTIFILTLILNTLTPIIADDFGYALNLDKEHLRGVKDIINFQIVHYNYWGGRSIAHSLVQLFLLLPKWIFNISNSLCYTLLVFLMYKLAKNKQKDNPKLLILIALAIYFLVPVFGQNILWLTGACNYLWTTTIVLVLINIFLTDKKNSPLYCISIFIFGIIAGWTNENTAFGLIVILTLILITKLRMQEKIYFWQQMGFIGVIIGFIILLIAPGNYVRSSSYNESASLISKIFKRFIFCSTGILKYLLPLLICLIVILIIYKLKQKKLTSRFYLFVLGTICTIYPMVLSPTFPKRAWFSSIIFLIIAIISLLFELNFKSNKLNYLNLIVSVLIIVFIIDYCKLIGDINNLNETWKYRKDFIAKNSNKKISFKEYKTTNKKNPIYEQIDLTNNPNEWPNTTMEDYFKVKSISTK